MKSKTKKQVLTTQPIAVKVKDAEAIRRCAKHYRLYIYDVVSMLIGGMDETVRRALAERASAPDADEQCGAGKSLVADEALVKSPAPHVGASNASPN